MLPLSLAVTRRQCRHLLAHITSPVRNVTFAVCSLISFASHADSVLIKNVHIVGGKQLSASVLSDVVLRDGKIDKITPANKLVQGKFDQTIDGQRQFLTPGLIDSHVHLDGVPGYTGKTAEDAPMLQQAREQMPRSYAYFGFTTVLDLTGDPDFIRQWNQHPAGPQAFYCVPVSIPNGYPAVWLGKELQFQVPASKVMLYDPAQPDVYPAHFKKEEHSPAAVVALAKQIGASCIKVFYETGFGPQKNLPVPSVELIKAVVEQAKRQQMPVYLHGNSQAAYEFALKTGIDTLVHGMWHETKQIEPLSTPSLPSRLPQIAKEIKQAGIAVQPTMQVLYGEQEEMNPAFFEQTMVAEAIPADLITWYQSAAGAWMKNMLAEQVEIPHSTPDARYQAFKTMYQKPLAVVRNMTAQLHREGATLQFGSDTPSGPFYTQFPGMNGRWEMDRWLEAGMSLAELFSAMTIANARALKLEDRIGSVEVGKQADLLLMKSNPLKNMKAYDQISHVILRGKAFERSSLSARRLPGL